jgi:hypothetical protein
MFSPDAQEECALRLHNESKVLPAQRESQAKRPNILTSHQLDMSNGGEERRATQRPHIPITVKPPIFQLGGSPDGKSSLEHSSKCSPLNYGHRVWNYHNSSNKDASQGGTKRQTMAVDSDTDAHDNAIDTSDDSSDWEDMPDAPLSRQMDKTFFQRVDSKVSLTSHQSLLTLMLAHKKHNTNPEIQVAQLTRDVPESHVVNSTSPTFEPSTKGSNKSHPNVQDVSQFNPQASPNYDAQPQPITVLPPKINPQAASSPRTTRMNMLSAELTEPLRRQILWERQEKSLQANALFKRHNISHHVSHTKQRSAMGGIEETDHYNASNWNQYFCIISCNDYHSKGW